MQAKLRTELLLYFGEGVLVGLLWSEAIPLLVQSWAMGTAVAGAFLLFLWLVWWGAADTSRRLTAQDDQP
jgi:hypothetical protein